MTPTVNPSDVRETVRLFELFGLQLKDTEPITYFLKLGKTPEEICAMTLIHLQETRRES